MERLENLKIEYWKVVARTRKSGRISPSVKEKIERLWGDYDEDVVLEALKAHMSRSPSYGERYTLGIMRNMQKAKRDGKVVGNKGNKFNEFEQQSYDMDQLEKELLGI